MNVAPDKQSVLRYIHMHECGLVNHRHTQPWATAWIERLDQPPAWLGELAVLTYRGDIARCLHEYAHAPPFEPIGHDELADYRVACLLLRHQQGAISWATCLSEAGAFVDGEQNGDEDCEFYYQLLNELELAEYDQQVERQQVATVTGVLGAALSIVRADFEPFRQAFRQRQQ